LTVKRGNPSACERGMQKPDSSSTAPRAKDRFHNPQGRKRANPLSTGSSRQDLLDLAQIGPEQLLWACRDQFLRTTTSYIQLRVRFGT